MVPSLFVFLDAIPLNVNGKVDRSALPAPTVARDVAGSLVAPRDPTEEMIAAIWAELLGLDEVGVYDNFFELGGHSLLATRVVSRVAQAFAIEVPLRTLFDGPTVSQLALVVEELVVHDDATDVADAGTDGSTDLGAGTRSARPELSFAQQRLWFLDQLFPDNPFYNITVAYRLTGELDVAALERSLAEIVARHETLRTTFVMSGGRPVQVVAPPGEFSMEVIDLDHVPADERTGLAAHEIQWRALRPFDLAQGPVVRAALARIGPRDHILGLIIHHVVADGWSLGVVARELEALYGAFREGRASPLAPLPLQYADFSAWQRRWLAGPRLEQQLAYWRDQLTGSPPALELPVDRTRQPTPTYRGASRRFRVPSALTETVRACGRVHEATLFMTALAAFQALLSRYTGSEDIVVGSPIAGRTRTELENLIGFFVNTLVLRTDCGGDPSFAELLSRVREVCLGAYAHQDLPFERLVEELAPDRTMSHTPLFQVMFVVQNTPDTTPRLGEVEVDTFELESGIAKADISLHLVEDADGMAGELFYATDLFDASTVDRFIGHYVNLLEAAVTDPGRALSELTVLSDTELHQVVTGWNDSGRPFPDVTIPELVALASARTPGAAAVVCGDRTLTYRDLDDAANRLAQHLRASGLGRGDIVGVCLQRSPELVVALLGILRCGAAYVPLDPEYPAARLAFMLDDTAAAAVVTVSALRGAAAGRTPERGVPRRRSRRDRGACADPIARRPGPDRPRVRPLHVGVDRPAQGGDDRAPRHRQPSLVTAARLRADGRRRRPAAAVDLVPPVGARHLRDALRGCAPRRGRRPDRPRSGRVARRNGRERCHRDPQWRAVAARRARERGGTAGPSGSAAPAGRALRRTAARARCTPSRRRLRLPHPQPLRADRVDHGRDRALVRRAGRGPTGGAGRSPDRQRGGVRARRPRPPRADRGDRRGAHRRRRPRARLPQQPRADRVAIRRAPVRHHTGVARVPQRRPRSLPTRRDARVPRPARRPGEGTRSPCRARRGGERAAGSSWDRRRGRGARADPAGGDRLVAYVVAGPGARPSTGELRTHVREQLPDYMVPSAFVALDALPYGPNGKLDRAALVPPDPADTTSETDYVSPRTREEATLTDLYTRILGVTRVGVHDDFFDLGGHSLLAVQLFSEIERALGVRLALSELFEDATVAGLAAAVGRERDRPQAWSSIVALRARGARRPLFLGPGLLGEVLCYRNLVRHLDPEQPVYGLQSVGLDGRAPPLITVPDVAAHFLRGLRDVQPAGPYLLGGTASAASWPSRWPTSSNRRVRRSRSSRCSTIRSGVRTPPPARRCAATARGWPACRASGRSCGSWSGGCGSRRGSCKSGCSRRTRNPTARSGGLSTTCSSGRGARCPVGSATSSP